MTIRSGFIDSDGLRIHYTVCGEGPPIVLVHGWGSDARGNWVASGWVEALRAERRVVTLDVRGHGRSDKPLDPTRYRYGEMARDVTNLLDALDLEQVDFFGYSMGAFMGAWLLGHHGDRFRSMILGGIGIETEASMAAAPRIAAALRAQDVAALCDPLEIAYRRFVDADPSIDARARKALAISALQMWPDGDPIALLGNSAAGLTRASAAVPVLAVVGENDVPYVDTVRRFVAAVPGAELCVLPGQDHLSAVAAPEFKDAVLSFLTRRP